MDRNEAINIMEDYKTLYEQRLERAKEEIKKCGDNKERIRMIENIFPELKESEDERIRKSLIRSFTNQHSINFPTVDGFTREQILTWLEKQGKIKHSDYPYVPGWRKNYKYNKPAVKHSVLMLTTHGVAEGEWLGEEWCQYRWSCKVKDEDVLYWLHLSDLETLEKENVEQDLSQLEKQCEQNPTDKVEPKFKVGDWVVWNGHVICHIDNIYQEENALMYAISTNRVAWVDSIKNFDAFAHLWTIQDAKDGDVLRIRSSESNSNCIFLYQNTHEIEPNRTVAVAHCCIDVYANKIEFGIQGPDCIDVKNVKPATKGQRDLLLQKMKEAGYEWDVEKKELKKIERKPVWSEEDDAFIEKATRYLNNKLYNRVEVVNFGSTFESIITKEEFVNEFRKYMKGE